jgi:hypothetical protein
MAEAEVLGHATLFNGGIYGAAGDIDSCSKKMVLDRILDKIAEEQEGGSVEALKRRSVEGAPHASTSSSVAVFGDGPVELRESRKRGGLAIGIASDEVRRYGLNLEKRTRLIKAGAHVVVPDFSQRDELLELLFNE